jgi:hypothetical protein
MDSGIAQPGVRQSWVNWFEAFASLLLSISRQMLKNRASAFGQYPDIAELQGHPRIRREELLEAGNRVDGACRRARRCSSRPSSPMDHHMSAVACPIVQSIKGHTRLSPALIAS